MRKEPIYKITNNTRMVISLGNWEITLTAKVKDAMHNLSSIVHRTPLLTSKTVNTITGLNVFLKMENTQKTGAFKIRGATNKILQLSNEEKKKGVIAASAGNHAQGVAYAAYNRGIKAKIYMPEKTPLSKVRATQNYGAEVVLIGESYQEAYEAALDEQKKSGFIFVHAFDDPDVIAGQGTIALEMLEQNKQLDTIVVPIGGGGLVSGIALAAKAFNPKIRIIGVQSEQAKATYNKFHHVGPDTLQTVSAIADGIAVKKVGNYTYPIINRFVDDVVTVTDEEIASTIVFMLERGKTLIEGAGAASLAAIFSHSKTLFGKNCGAIVSGGNLDVSRIQDFQKLANQVRLISLKA
jgi:threonine dehydratase